MRSQPARNGRTEAHNNSAIFRDAFIGPYFERAGIPSDDLRGRRIGLEVDLHYD